MPPKRIAALVIEHAQQVVGEQVCQFPAKRALRFPQRVEFVPDHRPISAVFVVCSLVSDGAAVFASAMSPMRGSTVRRRDRRDSLITYLRDELPEGSRFPLEHLLVDERDCSLYVSVVGRGFVILFRHGGDGQSQRPSPLGEMEKDTTELLGGEFLIEPSAAEEPRVCCREEVMEAGFGWREQAFCDQSQAEIGFSRGTACESDAGPPCLAALRVFRLPSLVVGFVNTCGKHGRARRDRPVLGVDPCRPYRIRSDVKRESMHGFPSHSRCQRGTVGGNLLVDKMGLTPHK